MADNNNIDRLFKEKLASAEVGDTSSTAWIGAKQLLDKHYRALLWKRGAFAASFALLLFGALWFSTNNTASVSLVEGSELPKDQSEGFLGLENESEQADQLNVDEGDEIEAITTPSEKITIIEKSADDVGNNQSERPTMDNREATEVRPTVKNSAAQTWTLSDNSLNPEKGGSINASRFIASMPVFKIQRLGASTGADILDRNASAKPVMSLAKETFFLDVNFGGMVAAGMKSSIGNFYNGIYGGLDAVYFFQPRVYGRVGLAVNHRNTSFDADLITDEGAYRFASVSYIELPIEIGYRFGARHQFGFGMAFSRLLNAGTYESTALPQFPEHTVISPSGSEAAFADLDVAGFLSYRFQLSRRLFAHCQVRYGLFDITDDEVFNLGEFDDRNHQLRLGLSYRLISR